jgi:hypothetical protein
LFIHIAPKDEEAGTFTNASIVTEPFLPSDSRFTTTKNIDLLPKLKLLNQATRFRKNREVKTVGKGCPTVQVEGAPQRTPMLLKVNSCVFLKYFSYSIIPASGRDKKFSGTVLYWYSCENI